VGLVAGAQRSIVLQIIQPLEHLGTFERVSAVDCCLVSIGPGFPLRLGLTSPVADLVQQVVGFLGRYQVPNGLGQVFLK